jgi:hypothetical protein
MNDIDVLFAAAGLALIVWAIITGHGHWLWRIVAVLFGAILLFIGIIFYNDKDDWRCR